jgi:hypothetical protein
VPLPGNYFSLTVGPNWVPTGNILVRPAFRWDFFSGRSGVNPFNDGVSTNQTMLGFDAIQTF